MSRRIGGGANMSTTYKTAEVAKRLEYIPTLYDFMKNLT